MNTALVWLLFTGVHVGWVQASSVYATEASCKATMHQLTESYKIRSKCIQATIIKELK